MKELISYDFRKANFQSTNIDVLNSFYVENLKKIKKHFNINNSILFYSTYLIKLRT